MRIVKHYRVEEWCLLGCYTVWRSVRRLLVAASVIPSSPILVTLMKEALSSSETPVLTRSTRRNIPEDTILHSYRRGNLKSYITVLPLRPYLFLINGLRQPELETEQSHLVLLPPHFFMSWQRYLLLLPSP
jgi:hypothetical protein